MNNITRLYNTQGFCLYLLEDPQTSSYSVSGSTAIKCNDCNELALVSWMILFSDLIEAETTYLKILSSVILLEVDRIQVGELKGILSNINKPIHYQVTQYSKR